MQNIFSASRVKFKISKPGCRCHWNFLSDNGNLFIVSFEIELITAPQNESFQLGNSC